MMLRARISLWSGKGTEAQRTRRCEALSIEREPMAEEVVAQVKLASYKGGMEFASILAVRDDDVHW